MPEVKPNVRSMQAVRRVQSIMDSMPQGLDALNIEELKLLRFAAAVRLIVVSLEEEHAMS